MTACEGRALHNHTAQNTTTWRMETVTWRLAAYFLLSLSEKSPKGKNSPQQCTTVFLNAMYYFFLALAAIN